MFKKFNKRDYLILRELVESSDTKAKVIAQKLNISEKTVRNRIAYMKSEGVYKNVIAIDPSYFGYNIKFDFFIMYNGDKEKFMKLLIEKYSFNIMYAGTHMYDDDYSLQCVFKKSKDMLNFKNDLENIPGLKIIKMTMVPFVFKDTMNWIPKPSNFKMSQKEVDDLFEEDAKNNIILKK